MSTFGPACVVTACSLYQQALKEVCSQYWQCNNTESKSFTDQINMAPCSAHVRPYARFDKKEAEDGNRGETWELDKNGATCMCSRDGLSEIYMRRFRNVLVVTGTRCLHAAFLATKDIPDNTWQDPTMGELAQLATRTPPDVHACHILWSI
jgi:hypothetical protein